MPDFSYIARTPDGQLVEGRMSAATRAAALQEMTSRDLLPVRIETVAAPATAARRLTRKQLATVFSQLADLLGSGVSLLRAVEIVAQQSTQPSLSAFLMSARERLADGVPLAEALTQESSAVPEVALSIVRAGEEGGFLDESLRQIADYFDRQDDLDAKLRGALAYPAFLTVIGGLVTFGMLTFFVPKFAPMFDRLARQGELPALTSAVLGLSRTLREELVLIVAATGVAAAFVWRGVRTPAARDRLDAWRLRLPVAGPIFRDFAVARFCRVLGTLLRNGVSILRALRIARDAPANRVIAGVIDAAADQLSSGGSLAQPLRRGGVFPTEVLEMIAVSEQANRLDQVLVQIAEKLEQRTHRRLEVCVRLLEPALLVVLAGMILVLVVALLLPVLRSAGKLA